MYQIHNGPAPIHFKNKYKLNTFRIGQWQEIDRKSLSSIRQAIYRAQKGLSLGGDCEGWQFATYQTGHDTWAVRRIA